MSNLLGQTQHIKHNKTHYPGTRQLCSICDEATEKCEDDSLFFENQGPLCEQCYDDCASSSNEYGMEQHG